MSLRSDYDAVLSRATVSGHVEEAVIRKAETSLGVTFPPSYRAFLEEFGAALGDGFEIAGLFNDEVDHGPPQWNHVVKRTLRIRRASGDRVPKGYIAVSGDGGDHIYYLDTTRKRQDGECPVIALGPGAEGVVIAEEFVEFVVRLSKREIAF